MCSTATARDSGSATFSAMAAYLTDGREIIVPVSMFPDIKHLTKKQREKWMVLDDQYFTFENMTRVYSVKDLLRL